MQPRLALNLVRAFLLFAFALLAGFVVFCLVLGVHAAPVAKATKPVVKIGKPYKAVRSRPVSAAEANALYLYWRDSVQFKALRKK